MASSLKCPWGVKAQFTIPFKSLFITMLKKARAGAEREMSVIRGSLADSADVLLQRSHSKQRGQTEPDSLHSS